MYDVVAIGELLIDFTCQSTDEEGYPVMAAHPGGAPANFLAALAGLGAKTAMIAKVGQDKFGMLLKDTLKKAQIEIKGIVEDASVFTTLAFVTLDEKGDREFSFARKPGADTQLKFEEADLSLIEQARVVHFGSLSLTDEPSRTALYQIIAYAKERNKLITYDPNLRKPLWNDLEEAKTQILWGLKQADIVKISDEEIEFLFGPDIEKQARYILDTYGVKLIFVTCGPNGCFFLNEKASGYVPGLNNIQVIDTTGAGDIFGGSALGKILTYNKAPEKLTLEELNEIAKFACAAAGLSVTRSGGISSVFNTDEIEAMLLGGTK